MSGTPVVVDTSALVSLGIPRADERHETTFDPLAALLTGRTVHLPTAVQTELRAVADYDDLHGTAAANVLAAADHYTVTDPYARSDTPDERPSFGLDDGETDAVVLANALGADALVTDEFGGRAFPVIHAALRGPRLVSTPQLVADFARGGHVTSATARDVLDEIATHRSWTDAHYVAVLRDQL